MIRWASEKPYFLCPESGLWEHIDQSFSEQSLKSAYLLCDRGFKQIIGCSLWLSKVFESVKPTNGGGGLIWAALGAKTMEIVNANMDVGEVHEDEEILSLDADLIAAWKIRLHRDDTGI